ncbi:unnamed protein product [Penicillium viridicatum]
MAAYWHNDLFQLVGSDSVLFVMLMTGTCCIRGSRWWLFRLLQSVVVWVADTEVTQAAETEKKRRRSQVTGLEKQTLATEGQVRDSVGRLPITRSYVGSCSSIKLPVPEKDRRYRAGP